MSSNSNLPLLTSNTYLLTEIETKEKRKSKFTNTILNNHIYKPKHERRINSKSNKSLFKIEENDDFTLIDNMNSIYKNKYSIVFDNKYKFKYENTHKFIENIKSYKQNQVKRINNHNIYKNIYDKYSNINDKKDCLNIDNTFQFNLLTHKYNDILNKFNKYYLKYDVKNIFDNNKEHYSSYKYNYFIKNVNFK